MDNISNKDVKNSVFNKFLLYFLVYAFIGWCLETFYSMCVLGHFVKRGFLYGPLCPIYGWGAIILINILEKYKSNLIKLFLASSIIFSIFEYIVGFALDAMFSAKWWDYTNDFMNLNGRISIFYSFAWGVIAILFINYIHPFVKKIIEKLLKKIPTLFQKLLLRVGLITVIIDTVLSCLKYLNINFI